MRKLLVLVALVALAVTPAWAGKPRDQAKTEVAFGIVMAQKDLWKEATDRFQKAVQLDPSYAAAWNNLAIGYEHEGKFDSARDAYEKAIKIDPNNNLIRQNYEFFKEINDRAKRDPIR
jgi:Tfp pilus assembly protein PilF